MHYLAYEMTHAALAPWRLAARWLKAHIDFPLHPLSFTWVARCISAGCTVFEGLTRRYGKPEFALQSVVVDGESVGVSETVVARKTFCTLLHFARDESRVAHRNDPRVLIVAPLSGHYAALLRGTVAAMLRDHDVYITDWIDARDVPLAEGDFDLDDYIDYVIEFIRLLGPDLHVVAVCQPSVPALAATARLAAIGDPAQPLSLTLIGGPIDTRRNPTAVNRLAEHRSLAWFEANVISYVPFPNPGAMRRVYPGFLQLTGFMTMNLERHATAHVELFHHLVRGDHDSARQHAAFYEDYLAVMDLPASFYLDTIGKVFHEHALARGTLRHRGAIVDCAAIRRTMLLTIEGERDDICGPGQTEAAHQLCPNIPEGLRFHHLQRGVGHFGVFNGTRWRNEVQPLISSRIRLAHQRLGRDRSEYPQGATAGPCSYAANPETTGQH